MDAKGKMESVARVLSRIIIGLILCKTGSSKSFFTSTTGIFLSFAKGSNANTFTIFFDDSIFCSTCSISKIEPGFIGIGITPRPPSIF